ncbi:MAG: Gfo/Idh/MocA family oxidoreductase [Saprospiraceae bacterium]|nr:Gfo/Idh/MocA family oxidoreductase [Saprospiraceae bacterium]
MIRVVCIGGGYFAQFHIEAWLRIPNVELVALCDVDVQKARKLAKRYGIEVLYHSVDTMIQEEDFDVADVITPPETHLEICRTLMKAGIDIVCQKPLTPDLAQSRVLAEEVRSQGVRFMVHENFRFQPWHRKIKQCLEEDLLGEIFTWKVRIRTGDGWGSDAYLSRQPYFREMPRFFMHETGVHYLDILQFLFGKANRVLAVTKTLNPVIRGEDYALVILEMENGVVATIDANRYNEMPGVDPRYTFGQFVIEGRKGTLTVFPDGVMKLHLLGQESIEVPYTHRDQNFASDCVFHTQTHFINQYRTGQPFEVELDQYLETLEVLEAIYKSSTSGQMITLP